MYTLTMSKSFTIKDLSARSGLNVRTIRYYIAQGLVPPPLGRGGGATYEPRHLERLQLIRRLQDAHQPLATIRAQLEGLDDAEVRAALQKEPATPPTPSAGSARDYVAQVLSGMASGSLPAKPDTKAQDLGRKDDKSLPRSHWERITLHPDIELHVRRPLARAQQRRLEELITQAKRLFDLDP
ncbi:putative transcriptional regulator [Thiorhodovibrio frisius]|uniref:Putative transcriptional regulator n=2 Tax=Thiorhodovibrio frisius TaxID=631362 RepID=H8YWJ9_9GAMM|nr:putative transcriptional regulator [Thiorhodovibrio frisius]WPL22918.1 DNA-binding transcriptional regulator CueR [Thiorhodovibrio frisius]